jgi:DNA-binding transcriptional MerR regulator
MKTMNRLIPGTTMKFSEQAREAAFTMISPVLEATGGLTLSQLSKLTGLEGTTIQNWIKRGWVSATKGKKYSEKQILRILLINMLRKAMKLEDIANLMRYINGDVEDTSDDIIEDILLYNILCRIIFTAEDEGAFDTESIKTLVSRELADYTKEITDADKLKKAMYVMVMGYRSGCLRTEMEKGLEVILEEM